MFIAFQFCNTCSLYLQDNNNERDAMLEKYMWAKLPGIPKKMKWPVQVKSVYEDQKQANVYCLADDRK